MITAIGTVENFITTPSPVYDDSPQGYHLEERLQATLQSAADERQLMLEFRLGEGSAAPSEQLLSRWLEEGELVVALCTGLSARPFVQKEDKTYRRQGREVQIGEETAHLDAMVVLTGQSMTPLADAPDLQEAVKAARAAYKRTQRDYRMRRNAERLEQIKAQLPERIRQLKERQAAKAAQATQAEGSAAAETSPNGRKR